MPAMEPAPKMISYAAPAVSSYSTRAGGSTLMSYTTPAVSTYSAEPTYLGGPAMTKEAVTVEPDQVVNGSMMPAMERVFTTQMGTPEMMLYSSPVVTSYS